MNLKYYKELPTFLYFPKRSLSPVPWRVYCFHCFRSILPDLVCFHAPYLFSTCWKSNSHEVTVTASEAAKWIVYCAGDAQHSIEGINSELFCVLSSNCLSQPSRGPCFILLLSLPEAVDRKQSTGSSRPEPAAMTQLWRQRLDSFDKERRRIKQGPLDG